MSARTILLVGSVALLLACADKDAASRTDTTAAAPPVVSLTASEYAFAAPDSIAAGWTTFRLANKGGEVHYGHIVRLDSGRTVRELVDAYAEAIRTSGPRPKWVTRFGGPGGTEPGSSSSVTQFLEPGSYVWICPIEDSTGAPHFGKGEVKPFVVRAADQATTSVAAAPRADVTIRLEDFAFAVDSPMKAGRHTVRVANAGVEPHDLVLMKLAPGKSVEDIRKWMNPEQARRTDRPSEPPPSLESLARLAGGHAAIRPGMDVFFEANLTPGEYVLICMATAPDGRSHMEHGMIRQVRVT